MSAQTYRARAKGDFRAAAANLGTWVVGLSYYNSIHNHKAHMYVYTQCTQQYLASLLIINTSESTVRRMLLGQIDKSNQTDYYHLFAILASEQNRFFFIDVVYF